MGRKNDKVYAAYHSQRTAAARRGIAWAFTFDTWLKVWSDSGKLEQRGRAPDQYCMSRLGDIGPYALDNVEIKTNRENTEECRVMVPRESAAIAAWMQRATEGVLGDEIRLPSAVTLTGRQPPASSRTYRVLPTF